MSEKVRSVARKILVLVEWAQRNKRVLGGVLMLGYTILHGLGGPEGDVNWREVGEDAWGIVSGILIGGGMLKDDAAKAAQQERAAEGLPDRRAN